MTNKPQTTEKMMYNPAIYLGVKTFKPPLYTQYVFKRVGFLRKKVLVKVRDGIEIPQFSEKIVLSVSDSGMLVGFDDAIEMYKRGLHD